MANTDQNITELPIKTASEVLDADYMLGIDLVEGYQVSTKDFADYAVNRAAISIGGKTQTTASAISEVRTTAGNAQPKESGKGLSANDFTNSYKSKLDGIAAGAEVNVQSDWNASSGDAAILHKPTTISGYGITDAYTKTQVDTSLAAKSDKSTTYTKMEVDEILLAPILGNFASAETSPASASHAVGEYLLYNNRLYKVLAAISAGQQLTIGTNIGQTNVAAELASQASAISALNSNLQKSIYYTDAQVSSLGGLKACVQDTVTNSKVTDGVFLGDFTAKTRYLMIGMLYNTRQYGTILLYSFGNSTSYRAKVSGGTVSLRQFTETDVS